MENKAKPRHKICIAVLVVSCIENLKCTIKGLEQEERNFGCQ